MDTAAYKAEVAEAFNQAAGRYDRLGVAFFTPMGRRLVDLAAPQPGHTVLDVGCGRGACLFYAAESVGPIGRVVGIDIAPAMVDEARQEADRLRLDNVELLAMDGESPAFSPASFDVIVGSYSIIFLPDAPAALAAYSTLLRDGGRIAFSSPVFTDDSFPFLPPIFTELIPRSLLRNLPPEWQPEELQRRFNSWLSAVSDLRRTLEQAGFTDVQVVDEPINMTIRSGRAWVDWSHTQGMRLLWQHLPAAESQQLRDRLITGLDELRNSDGPLIIATPVRFVTATVAR